MNPTSNEISSEDLVALVSNNLKAGEVTAEAVSDRNIGIAHYNLGKVFYDKGDLNKAEESFLIAKKHTEFPKDLFGEFKILGFLTRVASEKMEEEKAELYIQASEELMERASNALGSLNSEFFYNQGLLANYRGDFYRAGELYNLSMQKSKEENEPNILSKSLYGLASVSFQLEKYDSAINFLNQLKELLKILQKNYILGTMYFLKAKVRIKQEMYEEAGQNFKLALDILKEKGCWNLYGDILLNMGILGKKMGDYAKASWYFEQAKLVIDSRVFKRLANALDIEVADLNDSNVDLYLDRENRMVHEKTLGSIDFKHRFVLLEILFLLAQNAGSYYDKEELAKLIWKDEYNPLIHDKLIYTSISRLRKLVEPKSEKRKYIVRGKDGYTFNQGVKIRFHKQNKVDQFSSIGNVEVGSPV